jgi:FtsH-binding integral membrane protein
MSQERRAPAWMRAVALWHAAALIAASLVCYVYPDASFGDVAFLAQALLPIFLLGTALFALGVLLAIAAAGRSSEALRLALTTAFILDIQAAVVLLGSSFLIDNAELLGGIPPFFAPLVALFAFAIPAAAAVFRLRDKPHSGLASAGAP